MAEGEHRFKGIDLQSEGHVRLCEALEAAGLLFSFELTSAFPRVLQEPVAPSICW